MDLRSTSSCVSAQQTGAGKANLEAAIFGPVSKRSLVAMPA